MFKISKLGRMASAMGAAARIAATGALVAGLLGAGTASAQVARVVTANFAPLTDDTSPDKKGLVYDLVVEMMKLQKIDKQVEFMAWGDAVKIMESTPGGLAFPMTRNAAREDKYLWLTKIFDMNRSFASRPGGTPVNTIDEAKALKAVGTTANSASLTFLKEKGLTNIVEFTSSRDLMQALKDSKIDAGYQPNPFARTDWKAVGGQGALVFGEVQERSAAYLAANKASTLNPADWQGALQVLEQDGTVDRLLALYGMN
ncbi:MAG TPA: transporter substrate-binding domain-containing protein [Azospirillum sp.]|nr:transporter substrate-binding domain-containing protein [Azospirillum sp.]